MHVFTVISTAALVVALADGCSTSSGATSGGDDSGVARDGGDRDASSDASVVDASDAADAKNVCAPSDLSGFTPPSYAPPKHVPGACTGAQISGFLDACFRTGHTKTSCDTFAATIPSTCADCLATPWNAPARGAAVLYQGAAGDHGVRALNVSGCLALVGGAAGLDCAKKLEIEEACELAACNANCPVTDNASFQPWAACVTSADSAACRPYTAPATTCIMAEGMTDAGSSMCGLPLTTFETGFMAIAAVLCGGGSSDAGTD